MGLSQELVSQFAKVVKETRKQKAESIVYGTVRTDEYGNKYVQFDGSDQLTPVSDDNRPTIDVATANAKENDRVSVLIKNHNAIIIGNVSSPAVNEGDVETAITNFDIAIGEQIQANRAYFKDLIADDAEINKLSAALISVVDLIANEAEIEELIAGKITVTDLIASKIDADVVIADKALIDTLKANNANILSLIADNATIQELLAEEATISSLIAEKLSAKEAEIKYANIDFTNIGKAAMEYFYAESGLIKDVTVGDQTITGHLVGVTISGDLIEGNTVKADKLVIKGEDGLYYKLNIQGGATTSEQVTEEQLQNGLSGSVIIAKTITAEKISVKDLVAFDATIGGFNITENSIYSGVKESVDNTTRGIYMDNDGQMAFGDSINYIKFYKDIDGNYKLAISASSMILSSSNKTVEEELEDVKNTTDNAVKNVTVQYALSNSTTTAPTSGWSEVAPEWTAGKYMWQRVVYTYNNGTVTNGDPTCIAGATGQNGPQGEQGIQGPKGEQGETGADGKDGKDVIIEYALSSSSTIPPGGTSGSYIPIVTGATAVLGKAIIGDMVLGSDGTTTESNKLGTPFIYLEDSTWSTTVPDRVEGQYIWQRVKYILHNGRTIIDDPVCLTGEKGKDGVTGIGIKEVTEYYAVSTSNSEKPTEWKETIPELTSVNKYLWNYEVIVYTDNTTTETTAGVIGVFGDDGKGIDGIYEYYALSKYNNEIPGTWSDEIPTLTKIYKYLWNYEEVVFSDGTKKTTDPRIIGVYGDTGNNGRDAISFRIESSLGTVFLDTQNDDTVLTARVYKGSAELDAAGAYGYTWYLVEKDGSEMTLGIGKTLSVSSTTIAGKSVYFVVDDGGVSEEMIQLDTPVIELVEERIQLEAPIIYLEAPLKLEAPVIGLKEE